MPRKTVMMTFEGPDGDLLHLEDFIEHAVYHRYGVVVVDDDDDEEETDG